MPWIKQEDCTGCGGCVEECPTNAISIEDEKAHINMEKCIRCGKCHDVCPQQAVKHDSERIPEEVETNLEKTKKLMQYFKSKEEKQGFLERMIKHFNKEKIVAEKSLQKIKLLRDRVWVDQLLK